MQWAMGRWFEATRFIFQKCLTGLENHIAVRELGEQALLGHEFGCFIGTLNLTGNYGFHYRRARLTESDRVQ